MSDDEELFVKKARTVHYGSLATKDVLHRPAEQSAEKLVDLDDLPTTSAPEPADSSDEDDDEGEPMPEKGTGMMELDAAKPGFDGVRDEMMAEFARRRKARSLVVPTDDMDVKLLLRRMDEPIHLFGEDKPERRLRLKDIFSRMTDEEKEEVMQTDEERVAKAALRQKQKMGETTWYHEGPNSLRDARLAILKFSLSRVQQRLQAARDRRDMTQQMRNVKLQETARFVKSIGSFCSQFADSRPISFCKFSPNSQLLATSSWSGLCKVWKVPSCKELLVLRGHEQQASCVQFHPGATVYQDSLSANLASCCHAGNVLLWNLESESPLATLSVSSPHRVSRVAFHPGGNYLAACCHDPKNSWRLYDVEYLEEILFQEGHSLPVYDISFQNDGAVAATGGMDGYGRVWDLRTGKCVMFLEGHTKGIVAVDFSPNGYVIASGSQDNSMKIWDLRSRGCMYTVPAHTNLVSGVKFDRRTTGELIYSCSYDKSVKIWSHPRWQPLRELQGHDSRVMGIDVSDDGSWLVSSSFDKTFKLWSKDVEL